MYTYTYVWLLCNVSWGCIICDLTERCLTAVDEEGHRDRRNASSRRCAEDEITWNFLHGWNHGPFFLTSCRNDNKHTKHTLILYAMAILPDLIVGVHEVWVRTGSCLCNHVYCCNVQPRVLLHYTAHGMLLCIHSTKTHPQRTTSRSCADTRIGRILPKEVTCQ